MSVAFIAEASSNHGQDLPRALEFVDAAARCGCDAVKFQLFRVEELFAPEILAKSAKHRARVKWELPVSHLEPLLRRVQQRGIQFSCTREWRADPLDGLRPLRHVRANWVPA